MWDAIKNRPTELGINVVFFSQNTKVDEKNCDTSNDRVGLKPWNLIGIYCAKTNLPRLKFLRIRAEKLYWFFWVGFFIFCCSTNAFKSLILPICNESRIFFKIYYIKTALIDVTTTYLNALATGLNLTAFLTNEFIA